MHYTIAAYVFWAMLIVFLWECFKGIYEDVSSSWRERRIRRRHNLDQIRRMMDDEGI